ncbi:MAG: cob(I)yrinic acid a,c-diamide adenosyltransferase [Candidatus Schekmanbacteria bacterium]|nr:cob(I)yrinic acid a,c-diamide adenosyltransferase [Candidatus Schekmanbacteria bacterium]
MPLDTGLIQVYYGQGKGKTTAALGLALRAAGQGLRVYFVQFLKPRFLSSGEMNLAPALGADFVIERVNEDSYIGTISQELKAKSRQHISQAVIRLQTVIQNYDFDLIVLDEILNVLTLELISEMELKNLITCKHPQVELVLTGRTAPEWLIKQADLVTEIKLIKHPYQRGIKARRGIEF